MFINLFELALFLINTFMRPNTKNQCSDTFFQRSDSFVPMLGHFSIRQFYVIFQNVVRKCNCKSLKYTK